MPNFEVFKKRQSPSVKQPYVTLQKRGTISLNKAAHGAVGSPPAVELLYDRDEQIMGFRAIDPAAEHAYPLREANNGSSYMVSGTRFTQYYDIKTDPARRYPAYVDQGILCIDLKALGTEVTGSRTSRSRGNSTPVTTTPGVTPPPSYGSVSPSVYPEEEQTAG